MSDFAATIVRGGNWFLASIESSLQAAVINLYLSLKSRVRNFRLVFGLCGYEEKERQQ